LKEPEKALSFASKAQGQELLEQQRSLHRENKKLRGVLRKKVKNALRMLCKRAILFGGGGGGKKSCMGCFMIKRIY